MTMNGPLAIFIVFNNNIIFCQLYIDNESCSDAIWLKLIFTWIDITIKLSLSPHQLSKQWMCLVALSTTINNETHIFDRQWIISFIENRFKFRITIVSTIRRNNYNCQFWQIKRDTVINHRFCHIITNCIVC